MADLPNDVRHSVRFLYESRIDAEDMTNPVGTAFLVAAPGENYNWHHVFLVTNAHSARTGWWVGLRNASGKYSVQQLLAFERDDRSDLAVAYLCLEKSRFQAEDLYSVHVDRLQNRAGFQTLAVGDGVMVIGLVPPDEGKKRKRPTILYGDLSSASHLVGNDNGSAVDSIVLTTRIQKGMSGSPAYLLDANEPTEIIGVVWGMVDPNGKFPPGSAAVSPAYRALELLDRPNLREYMKGVELRAIEEYAALDTTATPC